jgi:hypothetical protein
VKDRSVFGIITKVGKNETECKNTDWIYLAVVVGCYEQGNETALCNESWLNGVK